MPHHTPLIATIVAGLVVAFIMGAIAHRLRVSPVAGYLFAGVLIGPFTPGFVANQGLANELAELGVILLMFGVGLHFSLRDLLSVKKIAVPGALVQITVATALGYALAMYMGWTPAAGLVFGLALSVASTVVLLRALQARDLLNTERGRIAVGWLIVEDLAMVLALVLLPPIAAILAGDAVGGAALTQVLGGTLLKIGGFLVLILVVGKRVIPAILHWAAHSGSREMFRLAVLSLALGVAFGAAVVFDVSFALGAFFAGMILGETQLSRRAAEETLPLRDAFAVLFFVSVGMLFNPSIVMEQPGPVAATVAIIIFGKSVAAFVIVRSFGHPNQTALIVSASLAQIGEFSFILAGLGTGLGVLPDDARDLILAGAILSILANPFIFAAVAGRMGTIRRKAEVEAAALEVERERFRRDHAILVGYGTVGQLVAEETRAVGRALIVIEAEPDTARQAERDGMQVVIGNAADPVVLEQAGIREANKLFLAGKEGFEAAGIAERAREMNPTISVIARAHSDEEVEHLRRHGAQHIIMGEREIASRMLTIAASLRAAPSS
jgi:monovalent cation:H+ antiporter-2, CPA2 family